MTAVDTKIVEQVRGQALSLIPFDPGFAPVVARWVQDQEALRWLAPSTPPPLTAKKVLSWQKPGGQPFLLMEGTRRDLCGYGELNPMRLDPSHFWLGHVIVRPDLRGRGLGLWLVRAMVNHAFDDLAARQVSLIVYPDNFSARRCYRRAGFREVGSEYHEFRADMPRQRLVRCEITASA